MLALAFDLGDVFSECLLGPLAHLWDYKVKVQQSGMILTIYLVGVLTGDDHETQFQKQNGI
jgi:hypothetical protein